MKKIIIIFTFFLLYHCGFEPIHSEKKIINYNYSISSIGFSGENIINNELKKGIQKHFSWK